MPKHDFFSPKAISNRIKAKGLQKLRWYCEMCQKQCRDENGFKCHQTSDSHLRQMLIKKQWGQNLSKFNEVQLLGGVTMNGEQIYTQAQEDITRLEEQIQNMQYPDMIIKG